MRRHVLILDAGGPIARGMIRALASDAAGRGQRDTIVRRVRGRYLDRLERRDGQWPPARRVVVADDMLSFVAKGGARAVPWTRGYRSPADPTAAFRSGSWARRRMQRIVAASTTVQRCCP